MEVKLVDRLTKMGYEINFEELISQRDWLRDQYAVLKCNGEDEYSTVEGLFTLMNGILQVLSYELWDVGYMWLPQTKTVTAYCQTCRREITWKWDIRCDGLVAYCPHCGGKVTFCGQCPDSRLDCRGACENQTLKDILSGDAPFHKKLEEIGINLTPGNFTAYMDWLNDEACSLSPSRPDENKELEGVITLLEMLGPILEKETDDCFYLPTTGEVTEYCPACETEVTLYWDIRRDGLKSYCPVCGERLMPCSMCPEHRRCDYDSDTESCFYNRGREPQTS